MRPLTADDVVDFRLVGHLDLSPDGTQIAFIEASFDSAADETVWHIRLVPADGSAPPRELTSGGRRDSLPRWSPDGRLVAFLSARDEPWRSDLHVVDVASGEQRRVATLPRGIDAFVWSPSGDGFALIGGPDYPDVPLRPPAADPAERRRRYLDRVIHVERFDYRTSGTWHDEEPAQVWWCPLDGEPVQVSDGRYPTWAPGWAPDGRITFASSREENFDREPGAQVWAVGRDGGEIEAHSERVTQLRGYAFDADGTLATVGLPVTDWTFGSHDPVLFLDGKDVSGHLDRPVSRQSEVQSLTLDYLTRTDSPISAPDGTLHFLVVDAACSHVYRLRDGMPEPVITGRRVVGDVSFGGDRIAFSASAPERCNAIYVCDRDGGGETLVYDPNPWLAERALGEIRHFPVTLDDGFAMDTWVVLPPDHAGGALPAILDIHPGPHSSFPWDFKLDHRIWASAGYAVISCNQPGSQGYGEAYASVLDGAWGEVDTPAYLAAVDEAVRLGLVDNDRVGVTGATYGGFAALWCAAHTDRFKAVVTNRAMSDLTMMYSDSDIGWSFFPALLGAEPWEDPELYTRLSPITYAEQIEAPVRLLAFNGNLRTTVAQSEGVFLRLRKLGRTTDLLVFPPGSNTVLMPNRPWSKIQMYTATLEWFDRYVRP